GRTGSSLGSWTISADLPVLIFHGTRDRVVPFASAAKLRQFLNPGDEFVTIEGGAHNNLGQFPLYRERLAAWLGR
ncbi:MAG TPA: alpha/beta hydrolase, partial [Saprospiraceae bacterium]|nr:alpha/beta hydrolase [Saprospiraceae bacterium]